jgi:hypothetical protein
MGWDEAEEDRRMRVSLKFQHRSDFINGTRWRCGKEDPPGETDRQIPKNLAETALDGVNGSPVAYGKSSPQRGKIEREKTMAKKTLKKSKKMESTKPLRKSA